jgi:hypothetical protein
MVFIKLVSFLYSSFQNKSMGPVQMRKLKNPLGGLVNRSKEARAAEVKESAGKAGLSGLLGRAAKAKKATEAQQRAVIMKGMLENIRKEHGIAANQEITSEVSRFITAAESGDIRERNDAKVSLGLAIEKQKALKRFQKKV